MIRYMYKDIYLPIVCNATKTQFYSILGECVCMTTCKFNRELKLYLDCPNSQSEKDLESQNNNDDHSLLPQKEKS